MKELRQKEEKKNRETEKPMHAGTKEKGEHRKKEGGKEAELKVQKEGERAKNYVCSTR